MENLDQQLEQLAREGWDKRSLLYYQHNYRQGDFARVHELGSPLYTKMLERSWLPAWMKLRLVLDQLGAYIDEHNFLQLSDYAAYSLWSKLEPLGRFNVFFRALVLQTYGRAAKKTQPLIKENSEFSWRLNLFRSYLDRQAIKYLRRKYSLDNDLLRLLTYAKQCGVALDFETGANYHNRALAGTTKDHIPKNMKVQLAKDSSYGIFSVLNDARMVEFIIDIDELNFVSQWDVIKKDPANKYCSDPASYSLNELEFLANTESFNYGIPYGKGKVPWRYRFSHGNLDGVNALESDLRKYAKRYWHAPKDAKDSERGYGDLVNSGGLSDVIYWQNIAQEKRKSIYQAYVCWLHETKKASTGIGQYISQSQIK